MTHIFNERTEIDGVVDTGADIDTGGGSDKIAVADQELTQVLSSVLAELKKMNMNIAIMADNYIRDEEV